MAEIKKLLIGTTTTIEFRFYDVTGNLVDLDETPDIKIYDHTNTELSSDTATKITTGTYDYNLVVPNNMPYISVECSGLKNGNPDCIRNKYYTFFTDEDTMPSTMPTLTVETNTYTSLEDANTFFNTRLNSRDWFNASDRDRSCVLLQATKFIDSLTLIGCKYNYSQSLQFPRIYDLISNNGYFCDYDNEIPQEIKDIQCLIAFEMLKPDTNKRQDLIAQGVTQIDVVDDVHEWYGESKVGELFTTEIKRLLKSYLEGGFYVSG